MVVFFDLLYVVVAADVGVVVVVAVVCFWAPKSIPKTSNIDPKMGPSWAPKSTPRWVQDGLQDGSKLTSQTGNFTGALGPTKFSKMDPSKTLEKRSPKGGPEGGVPKITPGK